MKKLTTKKLDAHISSVYYRVADGKAINIMDIGKVFKAARDAYQAMPDLAVVEAAIIGAVAKYCRAVN
jgi:hypothetical protein